LDAELVALASAAGTTVVNLLATDAWETAKSAVGTLWRRVQPDRAPAIEAELVETREALVTAQGTGRGDAAVLELTDEWQQRLGRLLAADPRVAAELRSLLDGDLAKGQEAARAAATGNVTMHATASGDGRIFQAAHGDQQITFHGN
jgi:hypothetical protein